MVLSSSTHYLVELMKLLLQLLLPGYKFFLTTMIRQRSFNISGYDACLISNFKNYGSTTVTEMYHIRSLISFEPCIFHKRYVIHCYPQ